METPVYKDSIWGGRRQIDEYGKECANIRGRQQAIYLLPFDFRHEESSMVLKDKRAVIDLIRMGNVAGMTWMTSPVISEGG